MQYILDARFNDEYDFKTKNLFSKCMFLKMLFIFFLGGRLDKSSNNHLTRVQEALFYNCINI